MVSEGHREGTWEDEAASGSQGMITVAECNHEGDKLESDLDFGHGPSPAVGLAVLSPRTILEETSAGRG